MISYVKGLLSEKSQTRVVIETAGLGYEIFISLSTYNSLPVIGEEFKVFTYHQIREDANLLFGFSNISERELFEHLISVSGVGARTAINILSQISVKDLKKSLRSGDINILTEISGIGKKTAQRLIVELKDKICSEENEELTSSYDGKEFTNINKAVEALISLGYKPHEAKGAILYAKEILGQKSNVEDYIKQGLKYFGK